MIVTIAFFAFVFLLAEGWFPRDIVMIGQAIFAIIAHCVMRTVTFAMNHSFDVFMFGFLREAFFCMTIARTRTADSHVIDGVVILFL